MRSCRSLTCAIAICAVACATLAVAAPNPKLANARRQLEDFNLDAATKSLTEALAVTGNDRATLLEILRLQGITWGTMGKSDKAREAFKLLLVLDPAHALSGDQPPRVRTPFYEAKDWATKNGALSLEPTVDRDPKALTITLTVKVKGDAFNLARQVAFHLQQGDGPARTEQVKLDKASGGKATAKVQGEQVRWWVDLMGDRDATLLDLGSAAQPNEEAPPKVVVKPDIIPPPPPPPVVVASAGNAWMRPTGIGLMGAGVVAGVVGGVLGFQSQDARNKVANAKKDADGVVIDMTQRQAAALDATARTNGLAANVLFGTGAALAATGLIFTLAGGSSDVTVAPAPGGVTVSGRF